MKEQQNGGISGSSSLQDLMSPAGTSMKWQELEKLLHNQYIQKHYKSQQSEKPEASIPLDEEHRAEHHEVKIKDWIYNIKALMIKCKNLH